MGRKKKRVGYGISFVPCSGWSSVTNEAESSRKHSQVMHVDLTSASSTLAAAAAATKGDIS